MTQYRGGAGILRPTKSVLLKQDAKVARKAAATSRTILNVPLKRAQGR